MSHQTLVHRLRAMVSVAIALVALAALGQLRPTWPSLPRSLSSPLTVTEVEQIAELLLWLALVALALLLIVRSLRAAALPPELDGSGLERLVPLWPRPAKRSPHRMSGSLLDRTAPDRFGVARTLEPATYVPSWARPRLALAAKPDPSHAPVATAPPEPAAAVAPEPAAVPRVLLLGPLQIPGSKRRRRARASADELIAYLALYPEGAGRDQLLEALWPQEDPKRSEKRLWQAASEARQLLDGGITRERGRYLLDRERVPTDVDELDRLLASARDAEDELAEQDELEQALALFRGEPLQGADYLWAEGPTRRLRATFLELCERVGQGQLAAGNANDALVAAERGLAVDELNEGLWRLALEAEGALGLREAVAERYDRLCRLLDERLGLEPDRQTRATHRRLLGQT